MIKKIAYSLVLSVSVLLALASAIIAQATAFKDVKYYLRSSPNSKPDKKDVVLNLDKRGRAIILVADNRVLCSIPFEWIKDINYERKNNHLVTVQYKDISGQGLFAQFELNGGNRDQILASIEAETGVRITRVS